MTDTANHLGSELQDFLDRRLDEARRAEVEAHLGACLQCRRQLEALRWVKDVALKQPSAEDLPPELVARISAALDVADRRARPPAKPTRGWPWRRAAAVGALIAAAVVVLLFVHGPGASLPAAVARDYGDYRNRTLSLGLRTSDPAAVEDFFARGGIGFPTRVFDLGMMRYHLVGGRIHGLRGRESALYAYQGPEGRDLVCQMYEGYLAELPRADELREHNGITFRVYRVGGLTLVFWQEGAIVCVLASDGDAETVIQVAYAKALKV